MWMYRRMMRISFSQHRPNEEVLWKVERDRSLIKNIRKRQLEFLGHILRKDGMENLRMTGFVSGKRSRGRQCIASLDSFRKWMNGKVLEQNLTLAKLPKTARDRQEWKTMITYNTCQKSLGPFQKIMENYSLISISTITP